MEEKPLRLFDPGHGVLCAGCPWFEPCGAAESEEACRPHWGAAEFGGEHVLHPALPWTHEYLKSVQGPDFATVRAKPIELPTLPDYLPQIRVRSSLRGHLDESFYAVRAKEVIGRRQHVLPAATLRMTVGLAPKQKLALLLFDQDEILERLWNEGARLVPEIAEAAYDLVVSPSYSAWSPRPRPEFLYNAKRSLIVFRALQVTGACAVPRVTWAIEHDVRRFARWLSANPAIEIVALDWSTYRVPEDWRRQLQGLALLDGLTRRQLVYLINGPSTVERCVEIYSTVPERRVRITNSTLAAPVNGAPRQLQLTSRDRTGPSFKGRCASQREMLRRATQVARAQRRVARRGHGLMRTEGVGESLVHDLLTQGANGTGRLPRSRRTRAAPKQN